MAKINLLKVSYDGYERIYEFRIQNMQQTLMWGHMLFFDEYVESGSRQFDFDKKETEFMQKLNAVARKSVDFLVCRRADFFIIAAVELNGPMHHLARQKKADSVKAHALQSAGIPLLIYTPDKLPSVFEIKQDFAPFLD